MHTTRSTRSTRSTRAQHNQHKTPNTPLKHSLTQALTTGAALRSIHIDRVLVSPLSRALETAALVMHGRDKVCGCRSATCTCLFAEPTASFASSLPVHFFGEIGARFCGGNCRKSRTSGVRWFIRCTCSMSPTALTCLLHRLHHHSLVRARARNIATPQHRQQGRDFAAVARRAVDSRVPRNFRARWERRFATSAAAVALPHHTVPSVEGV